MIARTSVKVVLDWVAAHWNDAKTFIEHMIGFSHDALHVLVGVCLQLLFAALHRISAGSIRPWLMVLTLEMANEWSDLYTEAWPQHAMQWGESAKDVLLTKALPTLLLLLARCRPRLLTGDIAIVGAELEDNDAPVVSDP